MTLDELELLEPGQKLSWKPPKWLSKEEYPELADIETVEVMFEGTQALDSVLVYEETQTPIEEQLFAMVVDNNGLGYLADAEELEVINEY